MSLQGTKPCKHVIVDANGNYGVCSREYCTFAHSLEEYKIPACSFDKKCYAMNNPYVQKVCMFKHTSETNSQYYKRTGKKPPNLPPTSRNSRQKPRTKEKVINTLRENIYNSIESAFCRGHTDIKIVLSKGVKG